MTTNTTYWDVANAARIPATKTTVALYPQQLSAVTKSRVVKALLSGVASGGYRAYGAIIARKLAAKFDLPLQDTWSIKDVVVWKNAPEDMRKELIKLVQADASAELLYPTQSSDYYVHHIRRESDRNVKALTDPSLYETSGNIIRLHFFNAKFRAKAKKVAERERDPEYLSKAMAIVELLNGTEPITIETF